MQKMSGLNIELLKKIRDAVVDEAISFDMSAWGVCVSPGTWWPAEWNSNLYEYEPASCGTPACIAGWALRLGLPRRRASVPKSWAEKSRWEGNEAIGSRAARLLGIPKVHGADVDLFHTGQWPEWADELPEREGAVALLDALIAGQDPWAYDFQPPAAAEESP